VSEFSTQTLVEPRPRISSLPSYPARDAAQASRAAAAAPATTPAPFVGFNLWRGLVFALAIEGIVLWAVLATDGWLAWTTSLYGLMLLALAAIDLDRFRLPDALTYPLLAMGLGTAYLIHADNLPDHLIGAAAGFLSFTAFREIYFRLRGREGLGLGDAKLMAAVGAWLSWTGLPSVVLIGAVVALAASLIQRAAGARVAWDHRVPFGTYLAVGAWLVWLYGPVTIL
jgi:leader peptidase (prepilin peptidase) / N-methyltransferase